MSDRTERDRQYTPKSPEKVKNNQDKSQLLAKRVSLARLAKPTVFSFPTTTTPITNDITTTTTTNTTTNTTTATTTSTMTDDTQDSTPITTLPEPQPKILTDEQRKAFNKQQAIAVEIKSKIDGMAEQDKLRRFKLRLVEEQHLKHPQPVPDIFRPPVIDISELRHRDVLGNAQGRLRRDDFILLRSLPPIKQWEKKDLKSFKIKFYKQFRTLTHMDPQIIREWYKEHHVSISTIEERKEVLIQKLSKYLQEQTKADQIRFQQTKQFATELVKAKYIRLLFDLRIITQFTFEKLLLVSMEAIDKQLLVILEDFMQKIAKGTTGQSPQRVAQLSTFIPNIITYLKEHPFHTQDNLYYGDQDTTAIKPKTMISDDPNKPTTNNLGVDTSVVDLGIVPEHIAYSDQLKVGINTIMQRTAHLRPCFEFEQLGFPDYISEILERAKFKQPTPVQSQGWPVILNGHDLIGIAPTGSGKTLTYLLPSIIHLNAQSPTKAGEGPIVLIIGPTRELAAQIYTECHKLVQATAVKLVSLHAQSFEPLPLVKQFIRGSMDILIGTPQLIVQLLAALNNKKHSFNLNRVTYLVLDEADILAHFRNAEYLCQIVDRIRPDRQTVLFSASWTLEVEALSKRISPTQNPYFLQIGTSNSLVTTVKQLTFYYADKRDEIDEGVKFLLDFTARNENERILVFVTSTAKSERAVLQLRLAGIPCGILHTEKSSAEFSQTLQDFRASVFKVLVSTDVAARGLDIADLTHVLNIGLPIHAVEFIHRVGRVGRAGKSGIAYNIISPKTNTPYQLQRFVIILQNSKQHVPADLLEVTHTPSGEPRDFVQKAKSFKLKELQTALNDIALDQEHLLSGVTLGVEPSLRITSVAAALQPIRDNFNPLEIYIDDEEGLPTVRSDAELLAAMKKDANYRANKFDDDDSDEAEWWEQVNRTKAGLVDKPTTMNDDVKNKNDIKHKNDKKIQQEDNGLQFDSDIDPDDDSDVIGTDDELSDDEGSYKKKSEYITTPKLYNKRDAQGNIKEFKVYTYDEHKSHKDQIHQNHLRMRENAKSLKEKLRWKETAKQDAELGLNATTKSFDLQYNERQAERDAKRNGNSKFGKFSKSNGSASKSNDGKKNSNDTSQSGSKKNDKPRYQLRSTGDTKTNKGGKKQQTTQPKQNKSGNDKPKAQPQPKQNNNKPQPKPNNNKPKPQPQPKK